MASRFEPFINYYTDKPIEFDCTKVVRVEEMPQTGNGAGGAGIPLECTRITLLEPMMYDRGDGPEEADVIDLIGNPQRIEQRILAQMVARAQARAFTP